MRPLLFIYFLNFYFRTHYTHISFSTPVKSFFVFFFASQALMMKKFASVPIQIIRKKKTPADSFVVSLRLFRFPSIYFQALLSIRERAATAGGQTTHPPPSQPLKRGHSPQIWALSSRPSSQSFSPSHSHCLAMHLFLEQANWFHRHEESAVGAGRWGTFGGEKFRRHKSNKVSGARREGGNKECSAPYRGGRAFLIKTQLAPWLPFAPWLACFPFYFFSV